MSEKPISVESIDNLNDVNMSEKISTESAENVNVFEKTNTELASLGEKVSISLESAGNSNVVLYSPPSSEKKIIKVHPENIRFVIHKRGFITCVCGNTLRKHTCVLENTYKQVKLKFDMCPKSETCRFCQDIVQWNYERFKSTPTGMQCRQCNKEIEFTKGICHDCFCPICYGFLNDCVCCKFCSLYNQCVCDDVNLLSGSAEEKNLA